MTATPPAAPLLGMYLPTENFPPGSGPSAWPSGPTTNLTNNYFSMDASSPWSEFGAGFITQCVDNGLGSFVELEPWNFDASAILFTAITGGSYDTWLTDLGRSIAASGQKCILTFAHEQNVTGQYPWAYEMTGCGPGGGNLSAANWILGWKYVHDKVRSTAGGLDLWMWAPGADTGGSNTTSPAAWWPGTAYVDMVGLDGYEGLSGSPLNFHDVFASAIADVRALGWSGDIYVSETNLALMVQSGGDSITTFVENMAANGMSGILEFEDEGMPQMTSGQWTEYNNAVAANFTGGGGSPDSISGLTNDFSAVPGAPGNSGQWYVEADNDTGDPSGPVSVSGGRLVLGGTSEPSGYTSVNSTSDTWDLTGGTIFVKVVPDTGVSGSDTGIGFGDDGFDNGWGFGVQDGNLYVQLWTGGSSTSKFSAAYNATSDAWLKISESGGTLSFWTSPDGLDWGSPVHTGETTESGSGWSVTGGGVQLFYGATTGQGSFASFNIAPDLPGGDSDFTPVGDPVETTEKSFTWKPAAVGNVLPVIIFSTDAGKPVTAVSSSNATWEQVVPDQTLGTGTVTEATAFLGTATSTSSAAVTMTTTATAGDLRVLAQEVDPDGATVALDTFVTMDGDVSGEVTAWPSVTPGQGTGEFLFGFERNLNDGGDTAVAGSTSGVTYYVDANGNGGAYDTDVSGPVAVGWGDSDSRMALVVLLYASSGGGGDTPPPASSGLLIARII